MSPGVGQLVELSLVVLQQVQVIAEAVDDILAVLLQIRGQLLGASLVDEGLRHRIRHAGDYVGILVARQHQVQTLCGVLLVNYALDLHIELVFQHGGHLRHTLVLFLLAQGVVIRVEIGELQGLLGNVPAVLVDLPGQFHAGGNR